MEDAANTLYYVVCWTLGDHQRYVLWRDGGNQPDEYFTLQAPAGPKLLAARSRPALRRAAHTHQLSVADDETQVVSLHVTLAALSALRPGRPVSARTARLLLDTWNALDDLAISVNDAFMPPSAAQDQALKAAYEKLFWGLNLPAVTPTGRAYHPILKDDERHATRALLRPAIARAECHLFGD
jgi:hypothetical protein